MSSLNQNVIRHKIGLLNLATELGNVSKACKVMGLSRDTFYRYQNAVAEGGVEALFDGNRRKPNPKNRVEEATETAVLAYATEQPAHGQVRTSNELRQRGIFVSPSGVRSIWLRNDLASFKQRLAALEKLVAEQGILLTDAQVAALERKQDDDLAHGEIETAHPGYLGSQDTFYVGTIKGVGRIYQQTFADMCRLPVTQPGRCENGGFLILRIRAPDPIPSFGSSIFQWLVSNALLLLGVTSQRTQSRRIAVVDSVAVVFLRGLY